MAVLKYKFVGYFPTVNLLKILKLFDGNKNATVYRLRAFRTWMERKRVKKPLPYLTVIDLSDKDIEIDYSHLRHGKLNAKKLMDKISRAGANLVVLWDLSVMLPSEVIFEEETKQKGWQKRPLVATFIAHYAKAPDSDYRKVLEEHMNTDELKSKLKHSSLDLTSLQDARFWVRGGRKGYFKGYKEGIMEEIRPIRQIIKAIDPHAALGRWRQYHRGKADTWVLVKDKSVSEA